MIRIIIICSVEDTKFVFATDYSWSGSFVSSGALLLELELWLYGVNFSVADPGLF
jgi:hypothetical protein